MHIIIFIIQFLKLGLKLLTRGRPQHHSAASLLMMRFDWIFLVARTFLKLKEILTALDRRLRLVFLVLNQASFIKKLNSFDLVLLLHCTKVAMRLLVVGIRRNDLGMLVFDAADLFLKHLDFVF